MPSDPLPADLAHLLDTALSEAKRRGHATATEAHLVLALVKDHQSIASRLGDDALDIATNRLARLDRSFDRPAPAPAATALLTACDRDDPLGDVADRLARWLAEPETGTVAKAPEATASNESTEGRVGDHGSGAMPESSEGGASGPSGAEELAPLVPGFLKEFVSVVEPDPAVLGRDKDASDVLALLSQRTPSVPLVVAPEGAGRTALLRALARAIAQLPATHPLASREVTRVSAEAIISANRAQTLKSVVSGLDDRAVVCVDDLEVVAGLGSSMGADLASVSMLRGAMHSPQRPMVLLLAEEYLERLRSADREFVDETEIVRLPPLSGADVRLVAARYAETFAQHHGVTIPPPVVDAACTPPNDQDRVAHPSLALLRLDRAAAVASQQGRSVSLEDLPRRGRTTLMLDRDAAVASLNSQVVGQSATIEAVVDRLVVTRAEMDARPERPDGVFMFVGPTGVGKTALAHALASVVFGDADAILRLDMSEYAEPHAVSKLVGSPPGYVGSTDPEGWLSTRIRRNPDVVLLLDEIEKAHPQVWNTFLQVFDAGRLTDSQGVTALFHNTVVVLTSNIGAGSFAAGPSLGFGPKDVPTGVESQGVLRAVKQQMPPELVNRLDEVLVFSPLSREGVHQIARDQLDDLVARMAKRGYTLTVTEPVVDVVVDEGFSREYGARPLQRAIERLLVSPLAGRPPGRYRAEVSSGRPLWTADQPDEGGSG